VGWKPGIDTTYGGGCTYVHEVHWHKEGFGHPSFNRETVSLFSLVGGMACVVYVPLPYTLRLG
jgi:hypothetical protein